MTPELTKLLRYLKRHRTVSRRSLRFFHKFLDPRPARYTAGYVEGYDAAMGACIEHLERITQKPKRKERQ